MKRLAGPLLRPVEPDVDDVTQCQCGGDFEWQIRIAPATFTDHWAGKGSLHLRSR